MILFLLPLLLLIAIPPADANRLGRWECGSKSFALSNVLSHYTISHCHDSIRDAANLCCKEHDLCYDVSKERHYTKEYCDKRFCHCLLDIPNRMKLNNCDSPLKTFCAAMGNEASFEAFEQAQWNGPSKELAHFVDEHPLGLDMKALVDACSYSKALAVHCHDSVAQCLMGRHERIKRMLEEEEEGRNIAEFSYEDCRSTMYDCMQSIIDSEANENCTAIAHNITKQVNIYIDLEEKKHGKAIAKTYPIAAARLLKWCTESTKEIEKCYTSFDQCDIEDSKQYVVNPDLLKPARRVFLQCHQHLVGCLKVAVMNEKNEDCLEARNLAIGLIRDKEIVSEGSLFVEGAKSFAGKIISGIASLF